MNKNKNPILLQLQDKETYIHFFEGKLRNPRKEIEYGTQIRNQNGTRISNPTKGQKTKNPNKRPT